MTVISQSELNKVGQLLCEFASHGKNFAIYGSSHRRTSESWQRYQKEAQDTRVLSIVKDDELIIACRGGRLYLENLPLPETAQQLYLYSESLQRKGRSGFVLSLDLTEDELEHVLLHIGFGRTTDRDEFAEPRGFRWISVTELECRESPTTRREPCDHLVLNIPELYVDNSHYVEALQHLAEFMDVAASSEDANIASLLQVSNHLAEQVLNAPEEVLPLTTVPYYDEFTYYHSLNVCLLTLAAARQVVTSEEMLQNIGHAALLHDLGKSKVPLDILYKNDRLTDEEMKIIMDHPVEGARMLNRFPEVDPLSVAVAFGHHIKDNGTGYPRVSPNFKMGPVTALIEVVDIFEALTAFRPYKGPLSAVQAFEVLYSMENMKSKRPYMDMLLRAIGYNPQGSRVRTEDGELGVVTGHIDNDPRRPMVRLVKWESDGSLDTSTIIEGSTGPGKGDESTRIVALDPEEDLEVSATMG